MRRRYAAEIRAGILQGRAQLGGARVLRNYDEASPFGRAYERTRYSTREPEHGPGPSGASDVTVIRHGIVTLIPDISGLRGWPRRPQRVQQRRTKGWRKPEGAVSVVRGTDWGNPFKVGDHQALVVQYSHPRQEGTTILVATPALAVALYREWLAQHYGPGIYEQIRRELGGKDLMCYCAPDAPCHADVLLAIANAPSTEGQQS